MSVATLNINLSSISKNWSYLHNLSPKSVATAAVVKANAYGLGVDPIVSHLFYNGVKAFFVSSATEAVELRKILPTEVTIYYLNGYLIEDFQAVKDYNIIPVLNSLDQIEKFRLKHTTEPAALQIDIGMNRLGLHPSEVLKAVNKSKSIKLSLIIGHLSSADDKYDATNLSQLNLFSKLSTIFSGIPKSLAATGGILLGPEYHFDLTRPGIGIFGGKPLQNAAKVVTINLPILQVKDIKKNDAVGYNHTFISKTSKKIATVASGYADGLSRQLSNSGVLYSENIKCPIIGRVSMDLITVDISDLPIIPSFLSVLSPTQTIDDLAEQCSTIGYEILTSLGSRYKRVYHY